MLLLGCLLLLLLDDFVLPPGAAEELLQPVQATGHGDADWHVLIWLCAVH